MRLKSRILLISTIIIFILTIFIGTSYSLWQTINTQDSVNTATTKCFNVEITSQKNSITLENAYPISNEKGKKLTPFSFTITNTCDIFASYTVSLESLKGTTLSSKFLNAMINNEEIKKLSDYEITDTVNTGSIESHILAKGSLGSGDSEDYTLRVWIDYDTTIEDLDDETKTFKSKIVVKAEPSSWSPVDEGYTTLHDAILANEYQSSPEVAIKKIEAKGTPDFSQTAPVAKYKVSDNQIIQDVIIELPTEKILDNPNVIDITSNNILPLLSTGYVLNEKTGKFALKNAFHTSIDNLDFSTNTYYSCASDQIIFNVNGNISIYSSSVDCGTIYKIISINKTISQKNSIETYKYTYKAAKITQDIIESDKSDQGLYKDFDDFGTTYYYRGNIKNNYVLFDNFYWRIIRINGDGSVRLLYYGKLDGSLNGAVTRMFNKNFTDNTYVGYMYGQSDGDSYSETHKNINNSNVKEVLDKWYVNNIVNNSLNHLISDSGFCNDRSIYSGTGIKKDNSLYTAYHRIYELSSPTFKCPNKDNDLFTLKTSKIGNKALTYPVALITADEAMYSGLINNSSINKLAYTYFEDIYWTMTPMRFVQKSSEAFIFPIIEGFIHNWGKVNTGYDVRPVISLKSDVEISGGIGTVNHPFVVKTE